MDGTSVSVVGYLPVGDAFSFFGKLGAFFRDVNATASVDSFGAVSDKSDGLDMAFGLGANWKVIENVGLRAEWERFQMNEDDVDLLSLGIAYTF